MTPGLLLADARSRWRPDKFRARRLVDHPDQGGADLRILLVTTLLTIWGERRIVGRMQQRIGPNRAGPQGVLQGLADGIKLMLKEGHPARAA